MIRPRTLACHLTLAVALILPSGTYGQDTQPAESIAASIQPEADDALRRMGQLLSETESFRFDAHITQDLPLSAGLKMQMYQHRSVIVSRPGKICVVSDGDMDMNTASFNNGALTIFDPLRGVYTKIEGPKDIDGILDHLALERGFVLPLADLLVSDPYASATERVNLGLYLGEHRVREHTCHHLAFRQEGIDWQIWIDAGETPVPRKLLITFTDLAGQPQWTAELDSWDLSPELAEGVFDYEPPANAVEVDFEVFAGRSE
jgi:hypothetical protein